MKVILAGVSKTGTKSMAAAFKELGLNVFDYMENFYYLHDDWIKICQRGGTTEDFRRMYQGVDAVTDFPCWYFWEEILKAFPDAKVVLTLRDDEEAWYHSYQRQAVTFSSWRMLSLIILSPSYRRFIWYSRELATIIFKRSHHNIMGIHLNETYMNESAYKKVYKQHNNYVIRTVPKDKLLIFNLKDGWEPLCNFLEVDVPAKPFPHLNRNASFTKQLIAASPEFHNEKRETVMTVLMLGGFLSYGLYKIISSANFCF